MAVSFSDLQLAFEFVSSGGMGENEAYLDRRSGKIYWHSEFGENDEELPDDIDDEKDRQHFADITCIMSDIHSLALRRADQGAHRFRRDRIRYRGHSEAACATGRRAGN